VVDSRSVDCCYDNCTINGVPNTIAQGSIVQSRYRIMLINCPEDEEPFVTDITSLAIDGDLEQEVSTSAQFCGEPVACTPWLDFYDDPVPICNEFP
jgi:hypothetical protein